MVGRLSPDQAIGERFDQLMATFDATMLIVTTATGDGDRAGCLVGFSTQCSIEPARFLVCLSVKNRTYRVSTGADMLAVHLAPADREDLHRRFGGTTGDEVDTFATVGWRPGPGGVPLVDGCPDWFVGRIIERLPFGDHQGLVLEPIAASTPPSVSDVTRLHNVSDLSPGHEP